MNNRKPSKKMELHQSSKSKTGFTLIELLVVIAIIALLVSIIMPALGKARYFAKRAYCLANVKAQHYSQNMYANDYDGKYIRRIITWSNGHTRASVKAMQKYIDNSKILLCPLQARFGYDWQQFMTRLDWTNVDLGGWPPEFQGWDRIAQDLPGATADTTITVNGYLWFAGYREPSANPDGDKPKFDFSSTFYSSMFAWIKEPEWPDKLTESTAQRAFITHEMYDSTASGFVGDFSHGGLGQGALRNGLFYDKDVEALDTPVGYADGHVISRLKSEMRPRAQLDTCEYFY